MKRLFVSVILLSLIITGCGSNKEESFVDTSGDIYVQMFKDGEQTEVNANMIADYSDKYEDFADDELFKTIVGMYEGFEDGSAAEMQAKAMVLLDSRR